MALKISDKPVWIASGDILILGLYVKNVNVRKKNVEVLLLVKRVVCK